jgi:hypothetical protein
MSISSEAALQYLDVIAGVENGHMLAISCHRGSLEKSMEKLEIKL